MADEKRNIDISQAIATTAADWNMKQSDERRVGMLKIKFTTLSFNLIASTRHWKLHTEGSNNQLTTAELKQKWQKAKRTRSSIFFVIYAAM